MVPLLAPRPPGTRAGRSGRARDLLGGTPLGPGLVAAVTGAGLLLLHLVDPGEPGTYPTCPFLALTGLLCPGCGSMRMLHHLTDGDVLAAAAMNPLALLLLPALVGWWGQWLLRTVTGRPRGAPLASGVVWAFLVVVLAYWVLRNVPGWELLAPG